MAINWRADCAGIIDTSAGPVPSLQGFECIFKAILQIAGSIGLILLFILLIMGGFKYMTSGGDPKASESASKTLTYAIAGLFMLVIIWLIMQFIESFTGVNVTEFTIPQ